MAFRLWPRGPCSVCSGWALCWAAARASDFRQGRLRRGLTFGFVVQGAATLPLVFAGPDRAWVIPLLLLVFVGGVANLVAIVGYVTTATSGLPDHEQGLATGW